MLATQIRKRAIIAVIGQPSATAPINGSLHGERKKASGGYGFPGPDFWGAGGEWVGEGGRSVGSLRSGDELYPGTK